jgi:hypothetical protein
MSRILPQVEFDEKVTGYGVTVNPPTLSNP